MKSVHLFGFLVAAQALHSIEEYRFRLWESFPPAQFLSGLISNDLELGFIVINVSVVAFGIGCYVGPIRGRWAAATAVAWGWVGLELINGVGHPAWAVVVGGYTPGLATSSLLLPLALLLARALILERQVAT